MTTTITPVPFGPEARAPGRRFRRRHVVFVPVVLFAVASIVATASWWFVGGAHLHAVGPGGGSVIVIGEPRNIAVELNSSGGAVKLVSARPVSTPDGITVTFVASNLTGARDGSLALSGIHVRPVRGTHVKGQGPENSVNLAVVLTAQRAGVFPLHDIEITYKAGARTRTARVRMDQCILAVSAKDLPHMLSEINTAELGDPFAREPYSSSNFMVSQYVNGCRA